MNYSLYSVDKHKVIKAYTVKNNCKKAGEHLNCSSLYSVNKLRVNTAYTVKKKLQNCRTPTKNYRYFRQLKQKIQHIFHLVWNFHEDACTPMSRIYKLHTYKPKFRIIHINKNILPYWYCANLEEDSETT